MSENRLQTLFEQADLLVEQGKIVEAKGLYEEICHVEQDKSEAWMMRGAIAIELGERELALTYLDRAIAIDTEATEAYYLRSNLHLSSVNLAMAETDMRRVVDLDRDHGEAWLVLGGICGMTDRPGEAVDYCRTAVRLLPDSAEALINLANALKTDGSLDEAITIYEKVVNQGVAVATVYSNLAAAYQEKGELDKALASYQSALEVDPEQPDVVRNMGLTAILASNYPLAQAALQRLVELEPGDSQAHFLMGVVLVKQEQFSQANACFRRSIELEPTKVEAYFELGTVLTVMHDHDGAIRAYEKGLDLNPDNAGARHILAGLKGQTTKTAPPQYVASLFDAYADTFDQDLVDKLGYRAPEILHDAVNTVVNPDVTGIDILDLGCGTGLCGTLFRNMARRLVGVDLSARMIEKAHDRAVYDALFVEDIVVAMQAARLAYDLIIAADVFIYVGDLKDTFYACQRALRGNGIFAFSTEKVEGANDFVLEPSGRYAHANRYIHTLAAASGFESCVQQEFVLRTERDRPIMGQLHVLRLKRI